jgi:hypothetical protein
VQLHRYFVSQSSEFCRHNPLCWFSTSNIKGKRIFRYRLSPETSGYALLHHFYVLTGFICPVLLLLPLTAQGKALCCSELLECYQITMQSSGLFEKRVARPSPFLLLIRMTMSRSQASARLRTWEEKSLNLGQLAITYKVTLFLC